MKNFIFLLIFLLSAGSGTLLSVTLRNRLGNKLKEMDEESSEENPEESSPEETYE